MDGQMLQNPLVNNFERIKVTSQFNGDSIKRYNEESDEGDFFEVDVQNLEKLHETHDGLSFLPKEMKVKKVEKLVTNLHNKTEYTVHIINLKQALNN